MGDTQYYNVSGSAYSGTFCGDGMNYGIIDYLFGVYGGSKELPHLMMVAKNWYTVALFHLGLVSSFYLDVRGEKDKKVWIGSYADYDRFWRDIGSMKLLENSDVYKRVKIKKSYVESVYKGKTLRFFYEGNAQLIDAISLIGEQFWSEAYKRLEVKGSTVIDIGANVGDSAIYFTMNGAKHTYAFEPYPYAYRKARRNISTNGLGSKITVINAGCGGKDTYMMLDDGLMSNSGSRLEKVKSGKRVPMFSLDTIAERHCRDDAVLKMDCEGYEYPAILGAKTATLRKFKRMMIEYHDGYRNLEARLRGAGFYVKHDRPNTISHSHHLVGLIFASRMDK
jgi:FkbM family methyltransferase